MILTFTLKSGKVVEYNAYGFYSHETEPNTYMIVGVTGLNKLSDVVHISARVK